MTSLLKLALKRRIVYVVNRTQFLTYMSTSLVLLFLGPITTNEAGKKVLSRSLP